MIRKAVSISVVLFGFLAAGGCSSSDDSSSDPVAECKKGASTICSKFFSCFSQAELDLLVDTVGNNKADCITKWEGPDQLNCTPEGVKCDSGKTYHADKASECESQFEAFSCTEFKGFATGATATPAACDAVCS